jgi:hypothetical protein
MRDIHCNTWSLRHASIVHPWPPEYEVGAPRHATNAALAFQRAVPGLVLTDVRPLDCTSNSLKDGLLQALPQSYAPQNSQLMEVPVPSLQEGSLIVHGGRSRIYKTRRKFERFASRLVQIFRAG